MKKLLTVAFGMLFVASFAFAQNTMTVNQTGDDNEVGLVSGKTITQDASAGGSNSATITQTAGVENDGDPTGGHEAYISQVSTAGDVNAIILTQTYGTNALGPKGAHTATLDQSGAGNTINGTQDSRSHRVAHVIQSGMGNSATFINGANLQQTQLGDNNTAYSSGGGVVTQYQDGNSNFARNVGNSATQDQYGDGNIARSTSFVSGSDTYQYQEGNDNESNFLNLRHSGNYAHSEQYGNNNYINANWNQNGDNSATVLQNNDGNSATIDFQSAGNTVDVTQDGMSNTVYSYQQ